jgi:hypothetical protein
MRYWKTNLFVAIVLRKYQEIFSNFDNSFVVNSVIMMCFVECFLKIFKKSEFHILFIQASIDNIRKPLF